MVNVDLRSVALCTWIAALGEGLAMSTQPEHEWTIMSAQWQFLKARFADDAGELAQLVPFVAKEAKRQEELEQRGVRSVSWRLLKALQAATGAEVLIGGTAVASPPFFRSMGRGNCAFWGELEGPAIVLWDHMDDQERDQWRQTFEKRNDWVILCSRDQKTSAQMDQAPRRTASMCTNPRITRRIRSGTVV